MKKLWQRIVFTFKQTWCWTLCLTLCWCCFVFFVGPLIAISGKAVLADVDTRIMVCVLSLALWLVLLVVSAPIRKYRRRKKLNEEQLKSELQLEEQTEDEIYLLRERLQKAMNVVKHSSFYGKRRSSRYELPWYLLLGDQNSGKTALLENSGIDFPLNRLDERMTKDIGQTQYCDWYFANQAVVIDASSRYMVQEENVVAEHVWPQFLSMLYQKRRRRPLNGIIFTLDISKLQNQGEQALEQYARTVRVRIQQIQKQLCADIPVYLILSKGDFIDGFNAFFDQLSREEREQIVGVTFHDDKDGTQADTLKNEFEELLRRINEMVLSKIHSERDLNRRGDIIRFPLQLAQIIEPLALFVEIAFGRNRYHLPTRLRGVYLTSAPQLEMAQQFDPSTISIGRNIGLQREVLPLAAQNRGFFIRKVFEEIIFNEGDLATVDTRYERGVRWTNRAAYLSALVILLGIGSTWTRVFYDNNQRQQVLREFYGKADRERESIPVAADTPEVLPVLHTMKMAAEVYPESGQSEWVSLLTLQQGQKINPVVVDAYHQQLRQIFLPKIKQLLEEQLRGSTDDRDYLMKSLRAYLMLHDKSHYDAAYLRNWVAVSWADLYSGQGALQNKLLENLDILLKIGFAEQDLDGQLVADTQQILRQESPAKLVYSMIKEDPLAVTLPVVHFDDVQGLQFKSFIGGDYSIPGLYTQKGYQDVFMRKGLLMIKDIMKDNWVLGTSADMTDHEFQKIYADVEKLYFRDYVSYWSEAVGQLQLRPNGDLNDISNTLNNLNSNQPIQRMLALIRDNTLFKLPENETTDAAEDALLKKAGQQGKLAKAIMKDAGSALEDAQAKGPKLSVTLKFAAFNQLTQENGSPVQALQDAFSALNAVQAKYTALAHAPDQTSAAYQLAAGRMSGQADELTQLTVAAARLPEPMKSWFTDLGADTWRFTLEKAEAAIDQQYRTDVYETYASTIEGKYPFAATEKDVSMGDFNAFFKPGGVLDQFVAGPLKPFFIVKGNQLLSRSIDGQGVRLSRSTLQQFQAAIEIRKAFFTDTGAQTAINIKVQPTELDANILRADFGYSGSNLVYQHGPIVPIDIQWPQAQGSSETSLRLTDLTGKVVSQGSASGVWSLFRFLDHSSVTMKGGEDVLKVTMGKAGSQVQYLFTCDHTPNPLLRSRLANFSLPKTL